MRRCAASTDVALLEARLVERDGRPVAWLARLVWLWWLFWVGKRRPHKTQCYTADTGALE